MSRGRELILTICSMLLTSCGSSDIRFVAPMDDSREVALLAGLAPPESREDSTLMMEHLARELAVALATPSVSSALVSSFLESTVPERKLHSNDSSNTVAKSWDGWSK